MKRCSILSAYTSYVIMSVVQVALAKVNTVCTIVQVVNCSIL